MGLLDRHRVRHRSTGISSSGSREGFGGLLLVSYWSHPVSCLQLLGDADLCSQCSLRCHKPSDGNCWNASTPLFPRRGLVNCGQCSGSSCAICSWLFWPFRAHSENDGPSCFCSSRLGSGLGQLSGSGFLVSRLIQLDANAATRPNIHHWVVDVSLLSINTRFDNYRWWSDRSVL